MAAASVAPVSPDAAPEDKLFTYAIVRGDLGMDPGKLASQATHACRLSLLAFLKRHPDRLDEFLDRGSCGSVVVLKAKSLAQLERARTEAAADGLPHALFADRDHVIPGTVFDGRPVVTALAVGPAPRAALRAITKRYQCL